MMGIAPLVLLWMLGQKGGNGAAKAHPPKWPTPKHPPPRQPKPDKRRPSSAVAPPPPVPPVAPIPPPAAPKRTRKAAPFVPQTLTAPAAAAAQASASNDARAGAIMLRDFLLAHPSRHGHRLDRPPEVVAAQRAMGLTPDGIVGPNTRARAAALGVRLPARGARSVSGDLYIP